MIELCVNGIIRLFLIIVKFGWNHWGWTVTLIVGLLILMKIGKAIGLKNILSGIVDLGIIEYVLFFPILFILLFMGLLFGVWIATLWTSYGFCEIIEEMSRWLL